MSVSDHVRYISNRNRELVVKQAGKFLIPTKTEMFIHRKNHLDHPVSFIHYSDVLVCQEHDDREDNMIKPDHRHHGEEQCEKGLKKERSHEISLNK